MGERYYRSMLKEIGQTIKNGKIMYKNKPPKHTEEFKKLVTEQYMESSPTAGNTVEICKSIADEHSVSANVIRKLLVDAGVYISQGQVTAKKATSTKVDKAKVQGSISTLIETLDEIADQDIILKLTGKASLYLGSVIGKLTKQEPKKTFSTLKGKAESIALLDKLIFEVTGETADTTITSKLTGKAAIYLSNIIERNLSE